MRVLVDLSAEFGAGQDILPAVVRIEREIARRLLDDASLKTLPIVFCNDRMYALDDKSVAALFTCDRAAPSRVELSAPPAGYDGPRRLRGLRLVMRVASGVGRRMINLTPERARPDARQSLRYARNALAALLRPAPSQPPPVVSPDPVATTVERLRLTTIVRPTHDHLIWTGGPFVDGVLLRQLAEAKLTSGFRVASIYHGASGGLRLEQDAAEVSADALATRIIDLLDASDVIFCVSPDVQQDLQRRAVESGRPSPELRALPLSTDPGCEAAVAVVRDDLRRLATSAPWTRR